MRKLLNKSDLILIFLTIVFSFGLYFAFKQFYGQSSGKANVYYVNHLVATLDLNEDTILVLEKKKYPLLLADLEIEVKDGQVRISKETSPYNICSKQGWSSSSINPLICLPNYVYIQIENEENPYDEVDMMNQ